MDTLTISFFGGNPKDKEWCAIRERIKARFKWGPWEARKFVQCGTLIEQHEEGFLLSQPDYLEFISEVHVSKARWQTPHVSISPQELHQLRSVLGALSWHANQVAPQWCAPVSCLLSRIHKGTLQEVVETNKLLRKAKLSQHQKLRTHKTGGPNPLLAAWVDADSNRIDGSSTKGIFIGWTSTDLLKGDLVTISPMFWQSARIQRTCKSSGAAETRAAADADDELCALRFQASEFLGKEISVWMCDDAVKDVDGVIVSDSKNLHDRLNRTVLTLKGAEKRIDIESL